MGQGSEINPDVGQKCPASYLKYGGNMFLLWIRMILPKMLNLYNRNIMKYMSI